MLLKDQVLNSKESWLELPNGCLAFNVSTKRTSKFFPLGLDKVLPLCRKSCHMPMVKVKSTIKDNVFIM